jgi:hypothetical protein
MKCDEMIDLRAARSRAVHDPAWSVISVLRGLIECDFLYNTLSCVYWFWERAFEYKLMRGSYTTFMPRTQRSQETCGYRVLWACMKH